MAAIGKGFVSILVFAAVFFFSYWLLFAQIFAQDLEWLATGGAFLTAAALAGLTWRAMSLETPGHVRNDNGVGGNRRRNRILRRVLRADDFHA